MNEDEGKKQIKAVEDHEKQLVEPDELITKDFNIEIVYYLKNKKVFNELVEERSSEFKNLEKRINPDNLIYKYKTEGISPKDFRNYQNPIELFKDLKDDNINPKEVLKDQINFKPDLREIKKGNKESKSEDQISVIQNVRFFFIEEKKKLILLKIIIFPI